MFVVNGIRWDIVRVPANCDCLRRSNGSLSVAVTDWNEKTIFVSELVSGPFYRKVITHELCHVFCMSYGIEMSIDDEEFLCDWVSNYGEDIVSLLDYVMRISMRTA